MSEPDVPGSGTADLSGADFEPLLPDELPPHIEHRVTPELTEAGEAALRFEELAGKVQLLHRHELGRGPGGVILQVPLRFYDQMLAAAVGAVNSAAGLCPFCSGTASERLNRLCLWPGHREVGKPSTTAGNPPAERQ